jgi:hypothetical protein
MWLLNTDSRELKEYPYVEQAPPYVILSHTWGDEEPSFKTWRKRNPEDIESKQGFNKVDNCCKIAAANGFEWIWVDT